MTQARRRLREIVTEMRRLTYLMSSGIDHQQEYDFLTRRKQRIIKTINTEEAYEKSKLREMVYQEQRKERETENRRIEKQKESEIKKNIAIQRANVRKTRRGN